MVDLYSTTHDLQTSSRIINKTGGHVITIYHISDLHILMHEADNHRQASLLTHLRKCMDTTESDEIAYLLVTGDIVDGGIINQYEQAKRLLMPFKDHLLLVPGNHDYGPIGVGYSPAMAKRFDQLALELGISHSFIHKQLWSRLLDDEQDSRVLAIGLNSVHLDGNVFDLARGEVGPAQLQELGGLLSSPNYADVRRLVFLHHRPEACGPMLDLEDREALLATVQNKVEILAYGHSGSHLQDPRLHLPTFSLVLSTPDGVRLLDANASVHEQKAYRIRFKGVAPADCAILHFE